VTRFETLREELRARPKRWLVTGAAGFIGSHLTQSLLGLGQTVVGLDNFSTGKMANLHDVMERVGPRERARFTLVEGDVRELRVCQDAMAGAELVLHEAALGSVPRSLADPLASHANNVDGFVNVLMAARAAGVRRVVFASSSSVYGDESASPKVESRIGRPLSPYAATKLVDEIYADLFLRTHAIDSVGLRYFNVFGPRQDPNGAYAAVIPRWTEALMTDQQCVVYGDGSASRDFCFVADVVQANLLAACASEADVAPRIFNVAAGARTTLLELFALIAARVERHRPGATAKPLLSEPPRVGDIPHSLASIERARGGLGFEPAYDVARGLDQTVEFFARQHQLGHAPARTVGLEEAS
jgi:UDP-N-acetylglucosamine 4-epimerase